VAEKTPVNLPFAGISSFCGLPIATDLTALDADVAVFGVAFDFTTPYRLAHVSALRHARIVDVAPGRT
jgi:hypothetical protein